MTSGGARRIFFDTNILVYASVAETPLHATAVRAILRHSQAGEEIWISRQILREYLATLTRPQLFSNPIPIATLIIEARSLEQRFRIAEDGPQVTEKLLDLLGHITKGGKQVHDTNIVATMQAYGITHLMTHNVSDFSGFSHLITVVPLT